MCSYVEDLSGCALMSPLALRSRTWMVHAVRVWRSRLSTGLLGGVRDAVQADIGAGVEPEEAVEELTTDLLRLHANIAVAELQAIRLISRPKSVEVLNPRIEARVIIPRLPTPGRLRPNIDTTPHTGGS